MAAMPALAAAGAGAGGRAAGVSTGVDDGGPSIGAWLKAGISQIALAPLTVDRMPLRPTKPSPLDDAEDSKPYVLARPELDDRGPVRIQDNIAVRLWRREIGVAQQVFRWLNDSAYFVSIPFLMILLVGAAVKSRPVAFFGATFVILLNLGRLAAGIVNLALVPLRDGLAARKLKKPVRRVVEPALTIALVFLAFTFVPWLKGGGSSGGTVADRLRASATELETEIKGEVDKAVTKAERIDVKKLGTQVEARLQGLGEPVKGRGGP